MARTAQSPTIDEGKAIVDGTRSVWVGHVGTVIAVFASRVDGVDPGHGTLVFVVLAGGDDLDRVPATFREEELPDQVFRRCDVKNACGFFPLVNDRALSLVERVGVQIFVADDAVDELDGLKDVLGARAAGHVVAMRSRDGVRWR